LINGNGRMNREFEMRKWEAEERRKEAEREERRAEQKERDRKWEAEWSSHPMVMKQQTKILVWARVRSLVMRCGHLLYA